MAYSINKTDGSIITSVPDGQTDSLSTDITLIGKNYSGFGEILNENLVKMLENFANVTQPTNPLRGEIWFDTSENRLKVYNGTSFATVGSATISSLQPTTLNPGDLWFNDVDDQLYFYDGTNTILIGPIYSKIQGLGGFRVEDIVDTRNQNRTVVSLYVGGSLIGIFSRDSFTPKQDIIGFSGSIVPGFNAGTISGLKLNATATNAEQLNGKGSELYLTKDTNNEIQGTLSLSDDLGLSVGATPGNGLFFIDQGNLVIANAAQDKDFQVKVRRGAASETAINIDTFDQRYEIYPDNPSSTLFTGGSVVINGDLTVNGDTTTVNTSTLAVEDKNIELAKSASPTDANADGGGITLKGTTDHTFTWSNAGTSWESSESINLETGKSFKINGVEVLSETSLGSTVVSAPGITSFGQQAFINVDDLNLNDNVISVTSFNDDLVLLPNGNGTVNLSSKRISNLAQPLADEDAANKEYVDYTVRGMPLVFSLDTSGLLDGDIVSYLTTLAPPSEFRAGTEARLLCTAYNTGQLNIDVNSNLNVSTATVFQSPSGTVNAVTNVGISTVVIPTNGIDIEITRTIKIFRVQAGAWVKISG